MVPLPGRELNTDEYDRMMSVYTALLTKPTEITVGVAYQIRDEIPVLQGSTYLDNDSHLYIRTETSHPLMAGNELPQTTEGA